MLHETEAVHMGRYMTLTDFVVKDAVRRTWGGVYPGERVMHAVMGLVYGAMLAYLLPVVVVWWAALTLAPPGHGRWRLAIRGP